MMDDRRKRELLHAVDVLMRATDEEKEHIFADEIKNIEDNLAKLNEKEDPFWPYSYCVMTAVDTAMTKLRKLTGINASMAVEKYVEHTSKAGRGVKYTADQRRFYCRIIELLVRRGASETQAMKFLGKLTKEGLIAPDGFLKELRSSYKFYKNIEGFGTYHEDDISESAWEISELLAYELTELPTSDEAAFQTAIDAFRKLCSDVISPMKEYHDVIAEEDSYYPHGFGCAIDWVKADYHDPIDYFFKHPSHKEVSFRERKRYLSEFINTIEFHKYG